MSGAAAANWDIVCDQGKTWIRSIRYGSLVDEVFTPFNNTGWSARMQLRKNYNSDEASLSISTATGEMTLGGADGIISFNVPANTMRSLQGKYVFDLELFQVSGGVEIVRSPVRGEVLVRAEVTR